MVRRPTVLCVQHVAVEPPGIVAEAVRGAGLPLEVARIDRGEPVPRSADGLAGLVVMGGPMGVPQIDRHPHLKEEMRLLEAALARSIPVLGICLGSQLLAAALGGRVERGPRLELGWLPVSLEPEARQDPLFGPLPPELVALHWHGDVFDPPRGASSLARSPLTRHQAFRRGTAWGILFHLEADRAQVEAMARAFPEDLEEAGVSEDQLLGGAREHLAEARRLGRELFDRWATLARGG
ncbi:MAG TPA: type 1 glutamine amidotransferase [Anaeromyxobacteraceae bacterium]|nr:type 1 glutamine amidotransferase [Anaeromyxobacteraceae bacterium]